MVTPTIWSGRRSNKIESATTICRLSDGGFSGSPGRCSDSTLATWSPRSAAISALPLTSGSRANVFRPDDPLGEGDGGDGGPVARAAGGQGMEGGRRTYRGVA